MVQGIDRSAAADANQNTFTSFLENAGQSFAYTLAQAPLNMINELTSQESGPNTVKSLPSLDIVEAPHHAEKNSSDWRAQQIGSGAAIVAGLVGGVYFSSRVLSAGRLSHALKEAELAECSPLAKSSELAELSPLDDTQIVQLADNKLTLSYSADDLAKRFYGTTKLNELLLNSYRQVDGDDLTVRINANTASASVVRGIRHLWGVVSERGGTLTVENFPRECRETIAALGLKSKKNLVWNFSRH